MSIEKIQNLIESYVNLKPVSKIGFRGTKCACCNDYTTRAGFKFEPNLIVYNCFNCGIASSYDGLKLTNKFTEILRNFGISENQLSEVKFDSYIKKQPTTITLDTLTTKSLYTPEVSLPDNSKRLEKTDTAIINYLTERKINWLDYPFYKSADKDFKNRVIIPFYKNGKIIYWQARTIINEKPRYKNCTVSRDAVIFNHDEIHRNYNMPLFVCEGIFDALLLNGISILGSSLNESKITILKNCRRPLIFVIDNDANGKKLGNHVLNEQLGSITFPSRTFYNTKKVDVNSMIIDAGKIYTVHQLLKNKIDDKLKGVMELNLIK